MIMLMRLRKSMQTRLYICICRLLDIFGMDDTIEHCVSCLCLEIGLHGLMFVRMDDVLGWGVCGCYMQMK